ncbi:MAG TPA: cytochrome c oxidase subunit II [Chloroflexota bacterium]
MESFDPVTRQGLDVSNLFGLELIISALLLALVLGWLILALVRFRAAPGDTAEPAQVHGNRRLELAWTVTPALTLAVVFLLAVQTMNGVDAAGPGAQRVQVIGHQWWWEYQFPDLGVTTANELHVPVGTELTLELESRDVIHSFYVPRFGLMRDLVPGKTNRMALRIDRPGTYDGACTQYCGLQHAWMRQRIIAEPRDQFDVWIAAQRAPASPPSAAGQQVFLRTTCVSCHAIRGLPATAQVGPDLTHFGSRQTLGAGVLENTPTNLRQWIQNPHQIKPGVLMPGFGSLPEQDLNALVNFLEGLK